MTTALTAAISTLKAGLQSEGITILSINLVVKAAKGGVVKDVVIDPEFAMAASDAAGYIADKIRKIF